MWGKECYCYDAEECANEAQSSGDKYKHVNRDIIVSDDLCSGYDWNIFQVLKYEGLGYTYRRGSGCSCNCITDCEVMPITKETWDAFKTEAIDWCLAPVRAKLLGDDWGHASVPRINEWVDVCMEIMKELDIYDTVSFQ